MKPLHEQCAELAGELASMYPNWNSSAPCQATRINDGAAFLRHLSTVLRHEGLTDEQLTEVWNSAIKAPGKSPVLAIARAIEQETAAPLLAEIARLKQCLFQTQEAAKHSRRTALEEAAKVCWISVDKYSCEHAIRALIGNESNRTGPEDRNTKENQA